MKKHGFTIPELLVTMTLFAILGLIGFIAFTGYIKDSRNTARSEDMQNIEKSIGVYAASRGTYPIPANSVTVTQSGTTLWYQGNFGVETVRAIGNMGTVPKDVLTQNEYTFSVSNDRTEYQIGTVLESSSTLSFLPRLIDIGGVQNQTFISGNYNGKILKVNSGGNLSLFAVPSIITNNISIKTLSDIYTQKKFSYDTSTSFPSSYYGKDLGHKDLNFTSTGYVLYTGSIDQIQNIGTRLSIMEKLQKVYSGTTLANYEAFKYLSQLKVDINEPSQELLEYECSFFTRNLKFKINCENNLQTMTINEIIEAGYMNNFNWGMLKGSINQIYVDFNNNIWFATSGGVLKYDGQTTTEYTAQNSGLIHNNVFTVSQDLESSYWFGTNNGLSKLAGTVWTTYSSQNTPGLLNSHIIGSYMDSQGSMWFATNTAISKLTGTTWESYRKHNSSVSCIGHSQALSFAEDSGYMWIGTKGGLNRTTLSPSSWGLFTTTSASTCKTPPSLTFTAGTPKLPNNSVNALLKTATGTIWAATDGGVSKITTSNNTSFVFTNYTTTNGLINNSVKAIYKDSLNNMWFGTVDGVSKFDGSTWTNYSQTLGTLTGSQVFNIYEESGKVIVVTESYFNQK